MASVESEIIKTTNVQVAVRCRPANMEEKKTGQASVVATETAEKKVTVQYGPAGKKASKTFNFDKVFGTYSTQEEVFDQMVRPIVSECLEGFNCTIFAYGQTGTGKTHTMEGDIHSEEHAGIVPRSVKAILETLESSGAEFTIRVSFLELYNEELQDLLTPPNSDKKLKLCEVEKKGVVCQNLEEITVLNVKDIFEILQRGIQQRQTAATLCNKNSSRSHSIFTLKIMIKECNVDGEEVVRHGQLNLVDLAGSECVGRSGAKNDRAREAGSINQSLLTLGRVITALVDHHGHIPYRDSKLTRLLQESLGGKAKTCIIATLSPSHLAVEESLSTLDYAHRAKNIKNVPQVNQKMTKKTVLKEYCEEIETLRAQLQMTRDKNGIYVDPTMFYGMEQKISAQEAQITECESVLKAKMEEVRDAKSAKEELEGLVGGIKQELKETSTKLAVTATNLVQSKEALEVAETELTATEAVVTEQTNTEGNLTIQGSKLQKEVGYQRSDRAQLLAKVSTLKEGEVKRRQETDNFVSSILNSTGALCSEMDSMVQKSEEDSAKLCGGVDEMLSKGRNTCVTLQGSIDTALSTLVKNAQGAKDDMTQDCEDLKTHLKGTSSTLEGTLQGLRGQLSDWLGEVDSAMQASLEKNELQKQVTTQLAQDVKQRSEAMCGLASSYLEQQQKQSAQVEKTVDSLQENVLSALEAYSQQVQQEAKTQDDAVVAQAQAMQEKMDSMISDLLATSSANKESQIKAAQAHVASAGKIVTDNSAAVKKAGQTMTAGAKSHTEALSSTATQGTDSTVDALQGKENSLQVHLEAATGLVKGVSAAVEGQRTHMNDTVASVVAEAGKSIGSASSRADSAALAAAKVLSDTQNATQEMTSSSSSSLKSFTSYMDGQGTEVCSQVKQHFTEVRTFLSSQKTGLTGVSEANTTFRSDMENCATKTTGNTPQKIEKTVYDSEGDVLAVLDSTRAHEMIKVESKSGDWAPPQPGSRTVSPAPFELEEAASTATSPSSSSISSREEAQEENSAVEAEVSVGESQGPEMVPPPAPVSKTSSASVSPISSDENQCPNPPQTQTSRSRASSMKLGTIQSSKSATGSGSVRAPIKRSTSSKI